jgi:hypothetical protein
MTFKPIFLIGSAILFLAIASFLFLYVRKAVVEADSARGSALAETDCAAQVPGAVDLVAKKDGLEGTHSRVTETANHYNQLLHQCYVEVTTYEHGDTSAYVKTLVSLKEHSAVLWSVRGISNPKTRQCFGADALPLDCATADKRWTAFMAE